MNKHENLLSGKLVTIGVVAVVLVVIVGVVFYQIGYGAGSNAPRVDSQQVARDSSEDVSVKPTKSDEPRTPVNLSGVGQQASDAVDLVEGLATVKIAHAGGSHFSIWVLDEKGNRIELLVSETGHFDGSKAFRVPSTGRYILDVSADGAWTANIQQ